MIPEEEEGDNIENEDDMALIDQANMGGIDQEQLTNEQKDEVKIKTLSSSNPQAPHNICQFSFKDRAYRIDDQVENLYFHVQMDGSILMRDGDDFKDQDDYWDQKKKNNQKLLNTMNAAIVSDENIGEDPRK